MDHTGKLYINGYDAYTTWGVTVSPTTLSELMTPAGNKELVSNESRLEHGKRVITRNPKKAVREVTLNIEMYAPDEATFLARYESFCNELAKGRLVIHTKYQRRTVGGVETNTYYRMDYKSCNNYQQYRLGKAKYALRLEEPDPTDRGVTSIHAI